MPMSPRLLKLIDGGDTPPFIAVSGASSGVIGQESDPITLTLHYGTDDVEVAITVDLDGTLSETTLTLTPGSPSDTLTLTPNEEGTFTLSFEVTTGNPPSDPADWVFEASDVEPSEDPSLDFDPPGAVTGEIGEDSGDFTVTLIDGVADTLITPSSSVVGDIFTPTSATATTGSPVITFKVKPVAAGARTISISNDQSIPNPSGIVYTANALPAAALVIPLKTNVTPSVGSATLGFTRATAAMVTDWEGLLRPVLSGELRFSGARRVRNELPTEDFTDAAYTKSSITVTGGATDPLGGSTAYTLSATGANGNISRSLSGHVAGDTATLSIWARRRTGTGNIQFRTGPNAYNTVTLTSSWQRISITQTTANTVLAFSIRCVVSGDEIDIWRGQVEDVSGQANQNPSEYVSVGVLSSPYHGAFVDAVKYFNTQNGNTVASNIVTEAVGAALTDTDASPIGVACAPAATNRCKQSQTLDNATWTKSSITVTADDTAAPTGQTTADLLTATSANGTCIQDLGSLGSAAYTYSVYLKRKTGSGNVDITLDGGSTWSTVAVTGSWTRVELTQTLANPDCGIRIVANGDEVWAWGAQVETGSIATGYIVTTTGNITRNADALTIPDTAYNDAAGTVKIKARASRQGSASTQRLFGKFVRMNAATIDAADGTNTVASMVDISANRKTLSSSWGSSSMRVKATGSTAGTGSFDGGWNGGGNTDLGSSSSDGATVPVVVSNLAVYSVKLNPTQQDLIVA